MAAPSPIPVVLVGCGAVSQQLYAPALRSLEKSGEVRVAAVIDPADDTRARLAAQFPAAVTMATLEGVTTVGRGALAIIASPAVHHRDQVIAAAARGWHILCEKPL